VKQRGGLHGLARPRSEQKKQGQLSLPARAANKKKQGQLSLPARAANKKSKVSFRCPPAQRTKKSKVSFRCLAALVFPHFAPPRSLRIVEVSVPSLNLGCASALFPFCVRDFSKPAASCHAVFLTPRNFCIIRFTSAQ
jgi:hypothetical protein